MGHSELTPLDPVKIQGDTIGLDERIVNLLKFFNGTFLEFFDALVTSDGATVTMSLEKSGGGDLTTVFSDRHRNFDCTPAATIALTPGTDEAPQLNYVYILQSAPAVLVKSISDWPSAEHIRVGIFFVPTAGLVNTGAAGNNFLLINQNINEEAATADGQGHLTHIMDRLRHGGGMGGLWHTGCLGTATQDGNDLWVDIAAGTVAQVHHHDFSALDSDTVGAGDPIVVVNDPDAAFTIINSLNSITKRSDGVAIGNNKYVKFVLSGVANKTGSVSPMLLKLPSNQYNTAADAATDVEGYADFSIPDEFLIQSSTGFLIASFVCKHTATGMELQSTVDLRGQTPTSLSIGGSIAGGGNVTAAANLTDNAVIRGDGGAKGIQDSGVLLDDTNDMLFPGAAKVQLDNVNQYLVAGNATTAELNAVTTIQLSIGGSSEIILIADELVFSQAGGDVGFGWGTNNKLDVKVGGIPQVTFTTGKVGLGLTTPQKDFHISSDIPTIRLSDSGASTDQEVAALIELYRGDNTNRVGFWGMDSWGNDVMAIATDYAAGELSLRTGSAVERLHISSTGRVTIPGSLEIEGFIYADTILESTLDSGVMVEGVLLKDGNQLFSGTNQLQLRDAAIHISSDNDGDLDLEADVSIDFEIGGTEEMTLTSAGLDVTNLCKAETFESDVAGGTAPIVVASGTVCATLNVDQVDGLDSTDLVLVDGSQALTADWDSGDFDIRAAGFRTDRDPGGLAGTVTLTNATTAGGLSAPTHINVPAGVTTTQDTWAKFYIGTVAYYFPAWKTT